MAIVEDARRLVADVGGTNTRIALYDPTTGEYLGLAQYANRDYGSLADIIAAWLGQLDAQPPAAACIAIAAALRGDAVSMVNIDWSFSRRELAERFQWHGVRWLNDFEANAHALPHLGPAGLAEVYRGAVDARGALATVGPGTGLGGATLRLVHGRPLAIAAEPGHAGLSPGNELELEIFRHLLREHPDIYAELLLSGPGLARLYRVLSELHGETAQVSDPAAVTALALAGEDPRAIQALETFCALLGSACGDFILANGAWGGLYLAGGIVPRFVEFLAAGPFTSRLQGKGAMHANLARIPVHVITAAHPGLVGAAHAPLETG